MTELSKNVFEYEIFYFEGDVLKKKNVSKKNGQESLNQWNIWRPVPITFGENKTMINPKKIDCIRPIKTKPKITYTPVESPVAKMIREEVKANRLKNTKNILNKKINEK